MANEDPEYLDWIRSYHCCSCWNEGPCEPHHEPGAGAALRSHDHNASSLCSQCHRDLHNLSGRFRTWNKPMFRVWHKIMVATLRAKYERRGEVPF